jgi:hypothetical protein
MRWILATCAVLFAGTLYLIAKIAMMDHCAIWHRGDDWTFPVVATVGANAVIGVCYFAIPAIVFWYAIRLRSARLPLWLSLLAVSVACFVLWCGATHWDAVFVRPVVYCTESLLIKLAPPAFSLISLAAFALCTEPLLLLAGIVARSKLFAPILNLRSPFATVVALRRIAEEMDAHG